MLHFSSVKVYQRNAPGVVKISGKSEIGAHGCDMYYSQPSKSPLLQVMEIVKNSRLEISWLYKSSVPLNRANICFFEAGKTELIVSASRNVSGMVI